MNNRFAIAFSVIVVALMVIHWPVKLPLLLDSHDIAFVAGLVVGAVIWGRR
jgi:hypothetical protein